MLDNTCSKRTKTLRSVNLLKYIWSSRFFIPKRCTGFGWRKKLGTLTSSEAFQLWKLFFRTVSIIWGDVSQKCCSIEDFVPKSYSFQYFQIFITKPDILPVNSSKKMRFQHAESITRRKFVRVLLLRSKFSSSSNSLALVSELVFIGRIRLAFYWLLSGNRQLPGNPTQSYKKFIFAHKLYPLCYKIIDSCS